MFRALWTLASGMTTQQTSIDVIFHNRATFQDLVYNRGEGLLSLTQKGSLPPMRRLGKLLT
jgi:flagellar basal body rod protein FlgG